MSGGLCTVLETAAKYAKISDWVQTNLLDEKNTESCLRLLLEIESQLLEVSQITTVVSIVCVHCLTHHYVQYIPPGWIDASPSLLLWKLCT